MKKRIINFFKNDYCLIIILLLYAILSLFALRKLGINYNIKSDDLSYINSGINFAKNHTIIMHGVVSAQIMPGMSYIIGLMSMIFGEGLTFITSLKILWFIFGGGTIICLYKIIRLFTNQYFALLGAAFLLTPDYILLNNLILTETPFMFFLLLLIYYSFKLADTKKTFPYIMVIVSYIICLFIRPNICLYPLILFIYLLLKKYDFKKLIKQTIIFIAIIFLVLTPWVYRNYQVFGKFIPLTYGSGNPLLLGTYQGFGYPTDEELDYEKNVLLKSAKELQYYVTNEDSSPKWRKYYLLEYDNLKAQYRMREWWKKDKLSMLVSYTIKKPKAMLIDTFYEENLFGISFQLLIKFRIVEFGLFILSCLAILLNKKYLKELILLLGVYAYFIILYCVSFVYGRYALALFPLRFITIGIGLTMVYNYIMKKKRGSNEKN